MRCRLLGVLGSASVGFPRSALLKRASLPLVPISRRIAEYKV